MTNTNAILLSIAIPLALFAGAYALTRKPNESLPDWIKRITKAEAEPTPEPGPVPQPEPAPLPLHQPPFGLIEVPLGYAGALRVENPEQGTRFPDCVAFVENTGTIAITDALLFWQRPDGLLDRVQKISHIQPGEIKQWYNSFLASEEGTVGRWTVYAFASNKTDLTAENYVQTQAQLLSIANFESTRYVK